MTALFERVTVVIINHETEKLVKKALKSLLKCYPGARVILYDNGSTHDSSARYLAKVASRYPNIRFMSREKNAGHGPALHCCTMEAETKFVFALDSDTTVDRVGCIEAMLEEFDNDDLLFAIGWLRQVNAGGVPYRNPKAGEGYGYVHPSVMLFDREKYLELPPFQPSGAPATAIMITAVAKGYHLKHFRTSNFITHLGWGTRRLYGGKWDPRTTAGLTPTPWDPHVSYPI